MPSKSSPSLLDRLRSGLSALARTAEGTVERIRGAKPTPDTGARRAEPPPPPAERPAAKRPPSSPPPQPPKPSARPSAAEAEPAPARAPLDPLGDTIAALRAVRRAFGGLEAWTAAMSSWNDDVAPPPIPEGARFDRHVFSCAAGTRDYRLYEPASAGARPKGLVVMLHGCRQTPEDFALGTRMNAAAETMGLLVAYPHQPRSANANGCWNWYRLADQVRHGGEPAILAGIVREIMERWNLGREQVFVAGLSAGGAMTAILTRTHPELFGAACIHSGVAPGHADDLRSGLAAMRGRFREAPAGPRTASAETVPLLVFQGDADRIVHPSNADRLLAELVPESGGATRVEARAGGGSTATVTTRTDAEGRVIGRVWHVADGGHAWFGGDPAGSYAVATGPDATGEMLRFFAAHGLGARRTGAGILSRLRAGPAQAAAPRSPS